MFACKGNIFFQGKYAVRETVRIWKETCKLMLVYQGKILLTDVYSVKGSEEENKRKSNAKFNF